MSFDGAGSKTYSVFSSKYHNLFICVVFLCPLIPFFICDRPHSIVVAWKLIQTYRKCILDVVSKVLLGPYGLWSCTSILF